MGLDKIVDSKPMVETISKGKEVKPIRYLIPGIRTSSMGSTPSRTALAALFPLSMAVGIPPIKRAEKA